MSAGQYFVATFGCRVNQADSAQVAAELERGGLRRTREATEADVVVLNTCTVTHRSDADVRKAVARMKREAPGARVIVAGCYAQRDPVEASAIPGVSAVVGNAHKSRLPVVADSVVRAAEGAAPIVVHSEMEAHGIEALPVEPVTTVLDRTRPFLKIQDGCDAHCTYCIIPEVRGPARGADPAKVVATVQTLIEQGYFEIVVAGIHLGTYHFRHPDGRTEDLEGLVRKILAVPGLGRLRLSCIEPMAFPMGLVRAAAEDARIAPHFHLPLQSGCDRILKRMVRPYRAAEYLELVSEIRRLVPRACLGTDVIVGFPGETDEEFEETCRFVEASPLDYVHVFSYSHRSGTPATRLDGEVDPRIIKQRSSRLNAISRRRFEAYLDRQVGQSLPGLVLEPDAKVPGAARALSDSFCPILLPDCTLEAGTAVKVHVERREGRRLVGRASVED